MEQSARIYVAGHSGMVGSAILRQLRNLNYKNLIFKSSSELDLTDQNAVSIFFRKAKPDYVFLAAAKVGGIHANNIYRGQFLYENLMIQNNVIHQAHEVNVKKLLFLGSSCIYPKLAKQPIDENSLLTGPLEKTNEPYAIAKIAGIKLCETYRDQYGHDFISAMPTNLYGPNDNYDLKYSHVLPALIRKFHVAKMNSDDNIQLWGTGTPLREFLHVDDLAEASVFLMNNYSDNQIINIGFGEEISIKALAQLIKEIVGYKGAIGFDTKMPDGTPRKLMDSTRINKLGWKPKIPLKVGIAKVYEEIDKAAW